MSVAWYIVLERRITGFNHIVDGKALGRAEHTLDALADDLGVQRLMQFFSASPEELADFAGAQGLDLRENPIQTPSEKWFSANDGLKSVSALMEALEDKKIEHAGPIIQDLKEFKRVLDAAREDGVRWHLSIDF